MSNAAPSLGNGISPQAEIAGVAHTLSADDVGKTLGTFNGSAVTITVPADSAVKIEIGSYINVIQDGAGQVTFAADTDVALVSADNQALTIADVGGIATLMKRADNLWHVFGNLTAV